MPLLLASVICKNDENSHEELQEKWLINFAVIVSYMLDILTSKQRFATF